MTPRAICFQCKEAVDYDPLFESPCGHDECPSAVFHGLCLMEWREHREEIMKALTRWIQSHQERGSED